MSLRKQAKSLVFLMLMFFLAWHLNALSLSVDDAVKYALEGNLTIKQSDYEESIVCFWFAADAGYVLCMQQ